MVLMNVSAGRQWRLGENRRMDSVGQGEVGQSESSPETFASQCGKVDGETCCVRRAAHMWHSVTTWRVGCGSGGDVQAGGNICISMADSRCHMAETSTTLQSNYPPITNKNKLKEYKWEYQ